jgi:hypothetical protein
MPSQVPLMMPLALGSMPYPGVYWPLTTHLEILAGRTENTDIAARAGRRQTQKLNDNVVVERSSAGQKSRQIGVQPEGKNDGACPGKNGWNDSMRDLVPQILNINIVDWEDQKPKAV